jgi:hypothetical protein
MISTMATYDPVYLGTYKFTFSNQADSLSGLVIVIGGVLAAAYLLGFNIAKSEISSKIGAWLSTIGMGIYFAMKAFNGYWTVAHYRTSGKVYTGVDGDYEYMYRYARGSLVLNMFSKT